MDKCGENVDAKLNACLHTVLTILEKEDDRSFQEKFWMGGKLMVGPNSIILRQVRDKDRNDYIEVRKEYFPVKHMLDEEAACDMVWNEHIGCKPLMCTIEQDGQYVGYCGINDTTKDIWEISIELQKRHVHKGIGTIAITVFVDEIKRRLGISEFRLQIEPQNYASQGLFEKLGAIPNGINEFLLHDEEELRKCEEENLHLIDENLENVAVKFGVESRMLLSHVLEYRLVWD